MFKAFAREVRDFLSAFNSGGTNAYGVFGGVPSSSGVSVTEMGALQSPVVFACHRILSALLAKTPLHVYQKMGDGGRQIANNHPLEPVLNFRPNNEMSSFEYKETSMFHCVSRGNSYAKIERDRLGRIAGLYPLSPFTCYPARDGRTGAIVYKFSGATGGEQTIAATDVLHIKNISLDGLVGLTPIQQYAKEAIGLDIALRTFGSRFIANGAAASMLVKFKGKITPENRKLYEQDIIKAHSGQNAHRALVLDQDGDVKNLTISPEEAQFLETRGYERDEIAECIYGVPSHLVGGQEETKAGIGEQNSALLANTMSSWFARFESALNCRFLSLEPTTKWDNADKYEIAFDTSEMDRYRIMETLKTIATGRQWSIITGQEGRKLIGFNPYVEDPKDTNPANKLWRPVNMVPISAETENEPQPAEPTEPDPQSEADSSGAVLGAARNAFGRVFRDSFNRVVKREKRDLKSVSGAFLAPISAISDYFLMEKDENFRSGSDFPAEISQFLGKYLETMTKRCTSWTVENSDEQCAAELTRALTEIKKRVDATQGSTKNGE